jgi:hypothetical protein
MNTFQSGSSISLMAAGSNAELVKLAKAQGKKSDSKTQRGRSITTHARRPTVKKPMWRLRNVFEVFASTLS